jgi:hypothetical protein
MSSQPVQSASEDVLVSSPMSFSGSSRRIMRLRRVSDTPWIKITLTALAVSLVLFVWAAVLVWYAVACAVFLPTEIWRLTGKLVPDSATLTPSVGQEVEIFPASVPPEDELFDHQSLAGAGERSSARLSAASLRRAPLM